MNFSDQDLKEMILARVPADGSAVGNKALLKALSETAGDVVEKKNYERARDQLIAEGLLVSGGGRGGSVKRIPRPVEKPQTLHLEREPLINPLPLKARKSRQKSSSPRSRASSGGTKEVISYRYNDKRKNNPHVGMVDTASDGVESHSEWSYDPHIDPTLQFDIGRAQIENLIDDALASDDKDVMQQALEQLRRMQAPYLNWTGKAERTSFDVDLVSLHVHERIDPATILSALQKQIKNRKGQSVGPKAVQMNLFSAPFENLPLRDAIDFYKHDRDWANRLIAGDSLLVMNSLIQKESMAGKVQMIYIDPPYGIKYGSNFQPFVNKRDVKDRSDDDLTQEPETIKAFRDTWELGIHSYLTYLRDRLLLSKELLHESGSVFVQISDENLHHVRELMDEIFNAENHVGTIIYTTSTGRTAKYLGGVTDFILWYGKSTKITFRQLVTEKEDNIDIDYELGDLTSQGESSSQQYFKFQGDIFQPASGRHWSNDHINGMPRIAKAGRITQVSSTQIRAKKLFSERSTTPRNSLWTDTQFGAFSKEKVYAVQTAQKVIERCLLMTTDPGDLVLDPTCGSGTTAFVAEKWGRRWITCDTSRVALTLAKQRLMTASYDYYDLKYPHEGVKGGFIYKTVPHITLKSIANNPEIDDIYAQLHPAVESALSGLNEALKGHDAPFKITEGGRKGKAVDFAAPDSQTVTLPSGETVPANALLEWEVPFDFPDDWPASAKKPFENFHKARIIMRKKMDDAISAHADPEILYDQPQVSKTRLRITGPFTVEAVPFPTVLRLEEADQPVNADVAVARSGETFRQGMWRDELLKTGIRGKGGQILKLADLEPLPGCRYIHAVGIVADSGDRVAVSFGPEHAALEQRQVEIAMREAGELFPLPKMLVFCAFTFDPEAAKDIDNIKGIAAIKVHMNIDLMTDDLKKKRAGNESFWLMGQPDVELRALKEGGYQVEVRGFDYFDTKTGELVSGGKHNIAMWELDTDYDDRSLVARQVFFPMAGPADGWHKLKKDIKAELDLDRMKQFHGTISLTFEAGENRCIAVKIIDDRGIESLKVMNLR